MEPKHQTHDKQAGTNQRPDAGGDPKMLCTAQTAFCVSAFHIQNFKIEKLHKANIIRSQDGYNLQKSLTYIERSSSPKTFSETKTIDVVVFSPTPQLSDSPTLPLRTQHYFVVG